MINCPGGFFLLHGLLHCQCASSPFRHRTLLFVFDCLLVLFYTFLLSAIVNVFSSKPGTRSHVCVGVFWKEGKVSYIYWSLVEVHFKDSVSTYPWRSLPWYDFVLRIQFQIAANDDEANWGGCHERTNVAEYFRPSIFLTSFYACLLILPSLTFGIAQIILEQIFLQESVTTVTASVYSMPDVMQWSPSLWTVPWWNSFNLDLCNREHEYLIKYTLIILDSNCGPLREGHILSLYGLRAFVRQRAVEDGRLKPMVQSCLEDQWLDIRRSSLLVRADSHWQFDRKSDWSKQMNFNSARLRWLMSRFLLKPEVLVSWTSWQHSSATSH